ncbi:MAG: anaerobic sulfatase maturase [Phycisphaerae bacterium]|nr:anaerobic sulfatase maturase [Phycisphaerae bacterium]
MISHKKTSRNPAHAFHLTIKPIGARCNLDCAYCYYLHNDTGNDKAAPQMSEQTLTELIRQHSESQDADQIVFTWQGGEPTLLGLDFFRKVVALQQKLIGPSKRFANDLQTNGVLLDDEWCAFLKQHEFLVGLSIDGPEKLHNACRVTKDNQPTFDKVVNAAALLRKHKVPFNTLTVVHRLNAGHPAEIYRFLTHELGAAFIQLIPCVEPKTFQAMAPQHWNPAILPEAGSSAARPGTGDSFVTDWSVDPDEWGEFLCRLFDEWYKDGVGRVIVDWFESLVGQWMGLPGQMCRLDKYCGRCLTIEHDGSMYSCDHYVYPEYRLGTIHQQSMAEMASSPRQAHFARAKMDNLPNSCKNCEYLFACRGGCPKDRFLTTNGEAGLNYLCSGLKRFFAYVDPYMKQIIRDLKLKPEQFVRR